MMLIVRTVKSTDLLYFFLALILAPFMLGTLANSEYPDELPHATAFHLYLQSLPSGAETHHLTKH